MKPALLATLSAVALAALAGPALAQSYTFKTVKLSGTLSTNPTGFGANGLTIGYDIGKTLRTSGFVQTGASSFQSVGTNIQLFGYSSGVYVGTQGTGALNATNGFMATSTTSVTKIAFPGSTITEAFGINKSHTVVGYYGALVGPTQFLGYTYTNGVFTTVAVPNAEYTEVTGINDAGVLAGWSQGFSGSAVGFIMRNGQFTTISVPGSIETFVQGINNKNQVVGYYKDTPQAGFTGFVYDGTTYTDVIDPAGTSTYAYGINDAGQVAGFAITTSGDVGYIATPATATK
jgi:hypothetical protein